MFHISVGSNPKTFKKMRHTPVFVFFASLKKIALEKRENRRVD